MRLEKAGYYDVENMASDKFINRIHYENFLTEYQEAVRALNKKD